MRISPGSLVTYALRLIFARQAPTMETDDLTFDDLFNLEDVEQEDQGGLNCEVNSFEARYNSKGERVVLSVGSRKVLDPPRDRAHNSALVLTRFYDKEKELEYTELEVRSPHVKAALKEVVPEYHDLNLRTTKVLLRDSPKCLFHYRKELQEHGSTLQDPEAVKHLVFALKYMYKALQSEIYSYYILVESASSSPSIDFLNLWMVFRPGDYVYIKTAGIERVLKFKDMTRCKCSVPWCYNSRWSIRTECIDYDGTDFGYSRYYFAIRPYDGYKALKDLVVTPLQYHPNRNSIIEKMVMRGRKFIGLHGIHHRTYKGVAKVLGPDRLTLLGDEEDEFPLRSTLVCANLLYGLPFTTNWDRSKVVSWSTRETSPRQGHLTSLTSRQRKELSERKTRIICVSKMTITLFVTT